MTTYTLSGLKAEIADDLSRPDLSNAIANAITDAITHYKTERFWFNVTRAATITTVAAQSAYTASDDPDIPLFFQKDGVHLEDGTEETGLDWIDQTEIELLLGNSPSSGKPSVYSFFANALYLHPVPDAAYTVRVIGGIEVAGPASDSEADNVWMTHGYELIRCRAKAYLYTHKIRNLEMAGVMSTVENSALEKLRADTSKKTTRGHIVPTVT